MNTVNIVKVTESDVAILQKICKQTFIETFSLSNTEEDMATYLQDEFSLGKLASEINNRNLEYYFAKLDDEVVGYLKMSSEKSTGDILNATALEIKRIYVQQQLQGKKIGHLLLEKAIACARKKNISNLCLAVWEENQKAIGFYKRYGFIEYGELTFVLGNTEQIGIKMKVQIGNE